MSVRRITASALLCVVLVVSLARPAAAFTQGDWCPTTDIGKGALDSDPPHGARSLVCTALGAGASYQPGQPTASASPPASANAPVSLSPTGIAAGAPILGEYCPNDAFSALASDAAVLICEGNHWTPIGAAAGAPGSGGPLAAQTDGVLSAHADGIPESIAAGNPLPTPSTVNPADNPLPYEMGYPNGLPPGVSLPPNTTVLNGFPKAYASDDWWKAARWLTEARIATTDMEAINSWFAQQCANIHWLYDARRVTRLPQQPPGPGYDYSAQMVIGECRTVLGSPTSPVRIRPWYLKWSVQQRAGSSQLELVVELGSRPHEGGRPG
jgi:hypothetical protein